MTNETSAEYEAPRVEAVVTPEELTREIAYAGGPETILPDLGG